MRKGVIAVGVVVLAAGAAAALYSRSRSDKDKPYKLVEVTRGPVVEKALAVGAIRPKREIAVKSKISGIVKRSFREVGDHVKAGDPLFEILPDPTPLELTEARREVEIAQNIYDQAKKRYDRTASLSKQGIVSNQDSDQADKEIEDAQIRLEPRPGALALVEKGRVRTSALNVESIIRAPISGTVLELLVNEGDPVVPAHLVPGGHRAHHAGRHVARSSSRARWTRSTWASSTRACPRASRSAPCPTPPWRAPSTRSRPSPRPRRGPRCSTWRSRSSRASGVVLRAGYSANADIVVREKTDVLLLPERLVTLQRRQGHGRGARRPARASRSRRRSRSASPTASTSRSRRA